MRSVAVADYRATAGNLGAWVLRRDGDAASEFLMLTMWDSLEAVRRFAGDPADRARYYDFDSGYLLDLPERVAHYTIDSDVVPPAVASGPRDSIGASCTLDAGERAERLAAWRAVRTRALSTDELDGGLRLVLAPSEPLEPLATLVAQESECCAFYRFTLRVDGPARVLEIDAGPGNAAAARALVGLD
jgi:heme-degrading monooxygenase HmoA